MGELLQATEWMIWILAGVGIGSATIATIIAAKRMPQLAFYWRKGLHVVALLLCALAIEWTAVYVDVLGVVLLSAGLGLLVLLRYGYLHLGSDDSYGIGLFAVALGVLLLTGIFDKAVIVTAALVLGLADAAAGVIGYASRARTWIPLRESKSLIGSATFLLVALLLMIWRHGGLVDIPIVLVSIAAILTAAEMLSARGSDNLSVPLTTAALIQSGEEGFLSDQYLWLLVIGAGVFVVVMRRLSWLTSGGILAALLLAALIVVVLPIQYLLVPVAFLGIGSLLSKVQRGADHDRTGRDAVQVLSNGLPAMIVLLAYAVLQRECLVVLYVLSFSVALTDTISSEVGRRLGGVPFDILRWCRVPVGLSGGVSLVGTLAGFVGALLLPLFVLHEGLATYGMVVLLSFLGMLIDSMIGSLLQAKYQVDGDLSDQGYTIVSGISWVDNNMVNLLSITATLLVALVLL